MEQQLRTRLFWLLQLIALCEGDRLLAIHHCKSTLYQDGKLAALYEEREFLRQLLKPQAPATVKEDL